MTLKRTNAGEIYFGEAKWTPWDTIDCLVEIEETGEVLEFHATPWDEEDYGRELFEMLSTKYVDQVTACPQEEKDDAYAREVRFERDTLLRESDWTAGKDVQLENEAEWMAYRQALRDITDSPDFPHSVVLPTPPEATTNTYSA